MDTLNGFKRGICRILDLRARNKKLLDLTVRQTDYDALAGDWENVGRDIRNAAAKYDIRECRGKR